MAEQAFALLKADFRSPTNQAINTGVALGFWVVGAVIMALAIRQLFAMLVMSWDDSVSGLTDSPFDFHPDAGRNW